MKKSYRYSEMVTSIDTVQCSEFRHLLNNVGITIYKIAHIESICAKNEEQVNKRYIDDLTRQHPSDPSGSPPASSAMPPEAMDLTSIKEEEEETSLPPPRERLPSEIVDPLEDADKENVLETRLMNRLFKVIALRCHPDKTPDETKHKIFLYANESKKQMDLLQTLYLLSKTDIGDMDLLEDEVKYIKQKVVDMEMYQQQLMNSVFYKWDELTPLQQDAYIQYIQKTQAHPVA